VETLEQLEPETLEYHPLDQLDKLLKLLEQLPLVNKQDQLDQLDLFHLLVLELLELDQLELEQRLLEKVQELLQDQLHLSLLLDPLEVETLEQLPLEKVLELHLDQLHLSLLLELETLESHPQLLDLDYQAPLDNLDLLLLLDNKVVELDHLQLANLDLQLLPEPDQHHLDLLHQLELKLHLEQLVKFLQQLEVDQLLHLEQPLVQDHQPQDQVLDKLQLVLHLEHQVNFQEQQVYFQDHLDNLSLFSLQNHIQDLLHLPLLD